MYYRDRISASTWMIKSTYINITYMMTKDSLDYAFIEYQ